MWLAGVHRGWEAVPELRYTSQCIFKLSNFFFFFKLSIWEFACPFQPLKLLCLLKTPLLSAWIHLPGWALLSYCSSPGPRHIPIGVSGAGQVCGRSEQGCMCPAGPGARVVEGLARETNTPGFVPHSSATAARPRTVCYFPSSPPLLPLRWPQMRPLLTARSPHSSPGLSHSGGTEHPKD